MVLTGVCNIGIAHIWLHSIDLNCVLLHIKFEVGPSISGLRNKAISLNQKDGAENQLSNKW